MKSYSNVEKQIKWNLLGRKKQIEGKSGHKQHSPMASLYYHYLD
jgi:hypothetical protein